MNESCTVAVFPQDASIEPAVTGSGHGPSVIHVFEVVDELKDFHSVSSAVAETGWLA